MNRHEIMSAHMRIGKTVRLIGTGCIAQAVAARLAGWGVNLLGTSRSMRPDEAPHGVRPVSLEEMLRNSDIVSMHTTLNAETRQMLGA